MRYATPLLLGLLAACTSAGSRADATPDSTTAPATPDRSFDPGTRFGALDRDGSEQDLIAAYGADDVTPAAIELGEGMTAPGTIVFADDPGHRFRVTWHDTLQRRDPETVRVEGERSAWTGPHGITLGMSLAELERINGRPFSLAGFGWDYGGTVLGWEGGTLAPTEGRLILTLAPEEDADTRAVLGDTPYSSADTAMQRLAPRVARILVRFE